MANDLNRIECHRHHRHHHRATFLRSTKVTLVCRSGKILRTHTNIQVPADIFTWTQQPPPTGVVREFSPQSIFFWSKIVQQYFGSSYPNNFESNVVSSRAPDSPWPRVLFYHRTINILKHNFMSRKNFWNERDDLKHRIRLYTARKQYREYLIHSSTQF